jgi:hypothetical protein
MARMKAGAKAMWDQYWGGTRQLWADAREARALRKRIRDTIKTDAVVALTRREARFLRRVADDLRALAPFVAFFMLPGSAYALPLIVRFFPGFLPSTYHPPRYVEPVRHTDVVWSAYDGWRLGGCQLPNRQNEEATEGEGGSCTQGETGSLPEAVRQGRILDFV